MNRIKKLFILLFAIGFASQVLAKDAPASFADLAEKLMPSVVNISTTTTVVTNSNPFPGFEFPPGSPFADMFKEFGTPQTRKSAALGSGFIIDEKGIVITNNHVIQDAEDIVVRVGGDKEYKATIIGQDPLSDIAVLQIDSKEKFIPVNFGDSDKARIGDWVIAIGNPFGLGGTVTAGIISARNRSIGLSRYEDYIQTDASINSGNSGGPLFDMNGNVIGINTAILGKGGSIGIGFSIPSNDAKRVVNQLIEFGETKRGWLGVRIQVVSEEIAEVEKLDEPRGALVASVAENSPSDKAGIKAGDIILEFNNAKIKEMKELPIIVAQTEVGKTVDVKIWRNKREITKKIKLGRLETSEDFKVEKKETKEETPEISEIKSLKIIVRPLNNKDSDFLKLHIETKREKLIERINLRTSSMINEGAVNEVKKFLKLKIIKNQSVNKVIGIAELTQYLNHEISLEEAKELILIKTRQYAKRQATWARTRMISWIKIDQSKLDSYIKKLKKSSLKLDQLT